MRLIGTGEDAGRHRGSLQAGTDAGSTYTSGPRVTGFVSAQHEDSSGKLWRRMRSKELGEAGDQEMRPCKEAGEGQNTWTNGWPRTAMGPSWGCAAPACPSLGGRRQDWGTLPCLVLRWSSANTGGKWGGI